MSRPICCATRSSWWTRDGRRWTSARTPWPRSCGRSRVGWLWSLPLRLPGLRALANAVYERARPPPASVSTGWASLARGVPGADSPPPERAAHPPGPTPLSAGGAGPAGARCHGMLITMVSETLFIKPAVPKFLKYEQPVWIKRLVAYPRFIQAWSMFASDAPMTDELVVDATTADGRHVDPYSEVAGRYPDPGADEIPARLDNDSFFFNYSGRIPEKGAYHQAFLEWILRYPERTGHPDDQIVRFDAYIVEDDSPPAGQPQPRNVRTRIFLSYPPRSR